MGTQQDVTSEKRVRNTYSLESAITLLETKINTSGKPDYVQRIEIQIEATDALAWLKLQRCTTKIYWADRDDDFTMAGIGAVKTIAAAVNADVTHLFERLQIFLAQNQADLRFYGGLRFYECFENDATWQNFGAYRFIIPAIELLQEETRAYLVCNYDNPGQAIALLKNIVIPEKQLPSSPAVNGRASSTLIKRTDVPHEEAWDKNISAALNAFSEKQLDKVVLARKSVFEFEEDINPVNLVQKLRMANSQLFYFLFQFDANSAFLGGSPELLYMRSGRQFKSEAIAGTRPCGETAEQTEAYGKDLLKCEKDLREHRFVLDSIEKNLQEICDTVDVDDHVSLLQLSRVQHLHCRLQGVLSQGITDAQIINLMHPTPAVGGIPKAKAIAAIRQLEHFDRGWYAAPIGYISRDEAEFVVAIRSALVRQNSLSLFSGAGIVEGSNSASEWEEIENKISNFIKVISTR